LTCAAFPYAEATGAGAITAASATTLRARLSSTLPPVRAIFFVDAPGVLGRPLNADQSLQLVVHELGDGTPEQALRTAHLGVAMPRALENTAPQQQLREADVVQMLATMRHVGVHVRTAGTVAEQQALSRRVDVYSITSEPLATRDLTTIVHDVQAPLRTARTDLARVLRQVPADEARLTELAQRFGAALQRPRSLNVAQLAEVQATFELANLAAFMATGTRGQLSLPRLVAALAEVIAQRYTCGAPDVVSLMLLAVWRALGVGVPAGDSSDSSEEDGEEEEDDN
jgi:hypothetical protein